MKLVYKILVLIFDSSFMNKNNCIPLTRNRKFEYSTRKDMNIEVIWGCPCINWSRFPLPFSRYDLDLNVVFFNDCYLIIWILLVSGFHHLIFLLKVDPQLKSNWIFLKGSRNLRMYYSLSSRHPLDISWSSSPLISFWILVIKAAL